MPRAKTRPAEAPDPLTKALTREAVRQLAGARAYARGEEYFADGNVTRLARDGDRLSARVEGTETYRVQLQVTRGEVDYSCTCPVGDDGLFCKHCVAVALTWLAEASSAPDQRVGFSLSELRAYLGGQEKSRLVDLLVNHAVMDDALFRALSLEMGSKRKGAKGGPDLDALKRTIRAAFSTSDFLSYREVPSFAAELEPILDTLADLLKRGQAAEVVELAELSLAQLEEAMQEADDSDGYLGGLLEEFQALHLAACKKAKPDQEQLAQRLFAWEMTTPFDTFYGAAQAYDRVLGKVGRAEYRRLAEAEWDKLPALGPGRSRSQGDNRFRVTSIMEALARASGDLEALVAVQAKDLSSAYCFLKIAQLYAEAKQAEQALDWAEKGVRAFPQHTDARLREFLAEQYHARRRYEEAMALIWAIFSERPTLEAYQGLKKHATRTKSWPGWRQKALEHIRAKAHQERKGLRPAASWSASGDGASSLLVQIYLWEKDPESAWQTAQELGCSRETWLELAMQREGSHPEQALEIYQRRVAEVLEITHESAYREAVERLKRIRALMKQLGRTRELVQYLESIRTANKRRRKLLQLLDAARL